MPAPCVAANAITDISPARLASQNPREGCSPARNTATIAVAAGSSPTITALCAEVRPRSAKAVKIGQPIVTPEATIASRNSCGRVGSGARTARRIAPASTAAIASRPMPTNTGSSSSTATRVAGSVKLKARTPRKPRNTGTAGDATGALLLHPERDAHSLGLVALERAPELVAARVEGDAPPLVRAGVERGERSQRRVRSLGAHHEVVRILAVVAQLDPCARRAAGWCAPCGRATTGGRGRRRPR